MNNIRCFHLREWERTVLGEVQLNDNGRMAAESLAKLNVLEVLEVREGLKIQAQSYVGRVRLGEIELTISPKISGVSFLKLLRYAYELRNLKLLPNTLYSAEESSFQDIFIVQLIAEVDEIVCRGLNKQYIRNEEMLTAPLGRINIQEIARQGGVMRTALPCVYYPRLENNWANQILLAGLLLAVRLTPNTVLRAELRRLAGLLQDSVADIQLSTAILEKAEKEKNRLITAYVPAFKLIKLLYYAQGYSWGSSTQTQNVKGFLFDMNRFFSGIVVPFSQREFRRLYS